VTLHRRDALKVLGAAGLATALGRRALAASPSSSGSVLILGAGFAGASLAWALKRWAPSLAVTVVASPARYWTCPFSNTALLEPDTTDALEVRYGAFQAPGAPTLIRAKVVAVEPEHRALVLEDGRRLSADKLVLAPGVEFASDAIEGYDADAEHRFPHAWEAGPSTLTLAQRLRAVPDGGLVVMTIPPNPYRCPPGPYERASLIAWWLQRHRPRSKLLLLDGKDQFTKDSLFKAAWAARYGNLEWQGLSDGAGLRRVSARENLIETDFDRFTPALANVIPPQRAPALLRQAGLDGGQGWCPVEPTGFESSLARDVHILGDAAIANPMPKSAFAANSQGKACAAALLADLAGEPRPAPVLLNTCYSLVAPDAGIAIVGSYAVQAGKLVTLSEGSGLSPSRGALGTQGDAVRAAEAAHARGWYASIRADAFREGPPWP
jgi:NADPH-dependent 2,4-dienoyl-CoA reductase/sulfur reductase-like enzyme